MRDASESEVHFVLKFQKLTTKPFPQVKPFLYIVNGKIFIEIKEFQSILDMFPKEVKLDVVSHKEFEIGSINETGHYGGLIAS